MANGPAPRKLMLIAVDVDSGKINEPEIPDPMDPAKLIPNPKPRVIGIVNEDDFDGFIQNLLGQGKAERPKKANHGTGEHPYVTSDPPLPTHVATILHTHHSPGCTWVTVNGWPFCYK
jgi:hypothetical protein